MSENTDVAEIKATPAGVVSQLAALGFTTAATTVTKLQIRKRKLAIAYEHYRFVREEKITAFNKALREKTEKRNGYLTEYQELSFTRVPDYTEVPPPHVLDKMGEAVARGCFDTFEVAHIVKVPDPILFGRVDGCSDRFCIDQWDNDVKIEDLLSANEG